MNDALGGRAAIPISAEAVLWRLVRCACVLRSAPGIRETPLPLLYVREKPQCSAPRVSPPRRTRFFASFARLSSSRRVRLPIHRHASLPSRVAPTAIHGVLGTSLSWTTIL